MGPPIFRSSLLPILRGLFLHLLLSVSALSDNFAVTFHCERCFGHVGTEQTLKLLTMDSKTTRGVRAFPIVNWYTVVKTVNKSPRLEVRHTAVRPSSKHVVTG